MVTDIFAALDEFDLSVYVNVVRTTCRRRLPSELRELAVGLHPEVRAARRFARGDDAAVLGLADSVLFAEWMIAEGGKRYFSYANIGVLHWVLGTASSDSTAVESACWKVMGR